jgi:oligopeptide transport system substrate-binding protein
MRKKFYSIFGLVMIAALIMSACAPAQAEPEVVEVIKEVEKVVEVEAGPVTNVWGRSLPVDAAPPEEQVLTLPCQENKHMDIAASFYDTSKSCGAVFLWERLVMLDANNKPVPGVATDWSLSEDGLTWTFNLRKDAKWSDGSPVTAGDFEYSLKRQLDPKTGGSFTWFYSDILNAGAVTNGEMDPDELGITAVDDYTLEISTTAKTLYLPEIMAFPTSAPVPAKVVESTGALWSMNPETALSNGPWKMTEYSPGVQIVLEPNEFYKGDHVPYIQKIIFKPGDGISDFPAYQAGELDGLFADQDVTPVPPTIYRMVKEDPILRHELYAYPYFATRYIVVNQTVEPWNDLKVRQAVAHAIDREALVNVIYDGLGDPAYGLLPIGFPAYVDGALNQYQEFNVELAQSLLAEAGYPGGKGFPEVELAYKTYEEALPRTAEMIQSMLKENLGINIALRPLESSVYNVEQGEGKINFGIQNWEFDYVDPSNFLNIYNPDLGRHKFWNNAEFNELTNKAAGWENLDERVEMYEQANALLSEDVGGVFLYHWGHAQMWKPYVKGFSVNNLGYPRVPYYHLGMHDIYVTPH